MLCELEFGRPFRGEAALSCSCCACVSVPFPTLHPQLGLSPLPPFLSIHSLTTTTAAAAITATLIIIALRVTYARPSCHTPSHSSILIVITRATAQLGGVSAPLSFSPLHCTSYLLAHSHQVLQLRSLRQPLQLGPPGKTSIASSISRRGAPCLVGIACLALAATAPLSLLTLLTTRLVNIRTHTRCSFNVPHLSLTHSSPRQLD